MVRTASALATSPAAWPPMPSATTKSESFLSTRKLSSLCSRTRPTSVAAKKRMASVDICPEGYVFHKRPSTSSAFRLSSLTRRGRDGDARAPRRGPPSRRGAGPRRPRLRSTAGGVHRAARVVVRERLELALARRGRRRLRCRVRLRHRGSPVPAGGVFDWRLHVADVIDPVGLRDACAFAVATSTLPLAQRKACFLSLEQFQRFVTSLHFDCAAEAVA